MEDSRESLQRELGMRIRLKRVAKRMNQKELAERAAIDAHEVSRLERGIQQGSTFRTLKNLAVALETSLDHLFGLEQPDKWAAGMVMVGSYAIPDGHTAPLVS